MNISFIKSDSNAILPKKNNIDDACYDLFSTSTTIINPGDSKVVPIGLELADITNGYWIKIENRSGNSFNKGLIVLGGIIDSTYRGEIRIKLHNTSKFPAIINIGNGVAQFSIQKTRNAEITFVNNKTITTRGDKGFGSSDKEKK